MQRADALEKQYSNSRDPKDPHNYPLKDPQKTPQGSRGHPPLASPMSRGSSVNSGLFDNLGGDEVHDFAERDHDGHSLALSDSGGGYDDSVYLPSMENSR